MKPKAGVSFQLSKKYKEGLLSGGTKINNQAGQDCTVCEPITLSPSNQNSLSTSTVTTLRVESQNSISPYIREGKMLTKTAAAN
jgi:hypothetical protein